MRVHKSNAEIGSLNKSAAETWNRGRRGLRDCWILQQVSVLARVSVRVSPGAAQARCAARSNWLTPQDPSQAIFFLRCVNSSQKHTLHKFITSKHLTQKLFVLIQKPQTPPPPRCGIGGCSTQAIGISTEGSLNRRQRSDASLWFVFTCHKRLLLSLLSSPVVQQALARFMNVGNKKAFPKIIEKLLPKSGLYCQNRLNNTKLYAKQDI